MVRADIAAAEELSREQKWPHRASDWTHLFDRGKGIVAERSGEIVGTTMCWRYGDDAATVGMVIVSPACQGQGIGGRLMTAVLDSLGDRAVFLNATDEGLHLYTKLGFRKIGTILQHQGTLAALPLPELQPNQRVRPLGASDRPLIAELDRRASGMDRRDLIANLVQRSQGVILDHSNEVAGFALLRRFGRGYAIGPTVAPGIVGAKALISHWLGSKVGKFCRLDVSGDSGLSAWLDELGLPCVGQVTTMVRGARPAGQSEVRLHSLISQALG